LATHIPYHQPSVTGLPSPFLTDKFHILSSCQQEVLRNVPPEVDTLVFPNYESLPERDDVGDPFLEVTLFKKNYAHVVSGAPGAGDDTLALCFCSSLACLSRITPGSVVVAWRVA
jgi:hypothetical protein